MTQKPTKKGQKHLLYLQDTPTSPHTGCLPPRPPFAIGNEAFSSVANHPNPHQVPCPYHATLIDTLLPFGGLLLFHHH